MPPGGNDVTEHGRLTPEEIRRRISLASITLGTGAGIGLAVWTRQGDWDAISDDGKRRAGQRALADLDQVLAELTTLRTVLAAALDDSQPATTGRDWCWTCGERRGTTDSYVH